MDDISSKSNVRWIDKIAASGLTDQFNINGPKFLALASKEAFCQLKPYLTSIAIQPALQYLTSDSYLEVTLPVNGLCDFLANRLKNTIWNHLPQPFASVLAINGWGGGSFPRPDFIVVKDILGTQYEILVDTQGQVEIPNEGVGLFSMLSEITLMYSYNQIIKGRGFENLSSQGAKPQELFLLPPPNAQAPFSVTLRTTRLEDSGTRQINFEKTYVFGVHSNGQQAQLTEFAARTLLRYGFCEADFARRLLAPQGPDELGIVQIKGFNDFTLSYEAIGVYYNLLISAIIHQHLPCEFILSKAENTSFSMIAFKGIPFDPTDYQVIKTLGMDALKEFSNLPPRRPPVLSSQAYFSLQSALPNRRFPKAY